MHILDFISSGAGRVAESVVGAGRDAVVTGTLFSDFFGWGSIQYVGFDTLDGYRDEMIRRNRFFNRERFRF